MSAETKRCAICRAEKPLPEFKLLRSGKVDSYCKLCRREYHRRWDLQNYRGSVSKHMRKEAGHGA